MFIFNIQKHPFKTKVDTYEYKGISLEQAYTKSDCSFPIQNVRFAVNDTVVEDTNYKPKNGDIVVAKVVPASEAATNFGVATFLIGAFYMVVGFVTGAVPLIVIGAGIALSGSAVIGISEYIRMNPFDNEEQNPSLHGSSNSAQRWNPIPVVYGEHYLSPEMIAPDWTRLEGQDGDPITYLHQLYILGAQEHEIGHDVIVDRISIGDNRVFDSVTMYLDGSIIVVDNNTAKILYTSSNDYTSFLDYLPMVPNGIRLSVEGCNRPQNNRVFKVLSVTPTAITIERDQWVTEESNIPLTLKYLKDTGVFTGVKMDIITDGEFENTAYPKVVFETALRQELKSGVDHLPFTTPENTHKCTVTITAPQGLYGLSGNDKEKTSVSVKVYGKHVDDDKWVYKDIISINNQNTPKERKKNITITFPSASQWMLKFEKVTADLPSEKGVNTIMVSSIICEKNDVNGNPIKPVHDDIKTDFAFLALNVKATDQLNGTINNLNCITRRIVRAYDQVTNKWVPAYTNNPAAIFVDILVNKAINRYPIHNGSPWDNPQNIPIDWATIQEWYLYCEEQNLSCNGVCSTDSTVKDELEKVATTGQATFTMRDGLFTVYIDKEKIPVQMFTPRNTHTFSAKRTFYEIPDGVKVKFIDKFAGYQGNEVVVDYIGSNKQKYDEVNLVYITDRNLAKRYGRYWLNTKIARQESFTFSTDIEYLVCTVGDRIKFQHDVPLFGIIAGRVSSVVEFNNQIISIITDEAITYDTTKTYAIELRVQDGNSFYLQTLPLLTPTDNDKPFVVSNTITFETPLNLGTTKRGDLFAFGEANLVTEDLMITDISTSDDLSATITAVKYDETIYTNDDFTYWDSHIGQPASAKLGVYLPDSTDNNLNNILGLIADNRGNKVFVDSVPVVPYKVGDIWKVGVQMFVATTGRGADEEFQQGDWKLATSDIWQSVSEDTFSTPNPEHRWYMSGGILPVLQIYGFEVDSEVGLNIKENILTDDTTFWESVYGKGAVTVTESGTTINRVVAKTGKNQSTKIVGRYGTDAWHGESFENLIVDSTEPETQSITLDNGHYVLQTYTGTVSCDYGTASPNVPLLFEVEEEHSVIFTTVNATYVSLTKTDFVPPYYDGSYLGQVTEFTLDSTYNIQGNAVIYNRLSALSTILQLYISNSVYISFGTFNNSIYVKRYHNGITNIKYFDIPSTYLVTGDLPFSVEYNTTTGNVVVQIGTTTFNILTYGFGYKDGSDVYLFGTGTQSIFGEGFISDVEPTKLYLGGLHDETEPYNNQIYYTSY